MSVAIVLDSVPGDLVLGSTFGGKEYCGGLTVDPPKRYVHWEHVNVTLY